MSRYIFAENMRKEYEALAVPMAFYEYVENDKAVPLLVTDGFCRMMDLSREQLMEHLQGSMFEKIHPDDAGKVIKAVKEFVGKTAGYDIIYRSRYTFHDDYHYVYSTGFWQTLPDGKELMAVTYLDMDTCVDETKKLTSDYSLFQKDNFYTDPLTGLPNLNYLNQLADEWVNTLRIHKKTPVLIYTDVVSMQYYNDQYGYQEGNRLLSVIADTLRAEFPDALLVRGQDDHFIVIDEYLAEPATSEKMYHVNEVIRNTAAGNTGGIIAGIHVYEEKTPTAEALDNAKKAIKWVGNDLSRICRYYSQMADDRFWHHRYILDNFDKALQEGWIRIYYQAIMRPETGKVAAMEALARWIDPTLGIISPGEFIPVLEKHHLLYKLDLYMAEQVCREIPMREESGLPLVPVSVNFSAMDFDYMDIPETLNEIYNRYCPELSPEAKYLIIEITEQDMARATERFQEQLRRLKRRGFRLWLDDFGSGYSSLNVFSRFSVDLIKFDMELLKNLDDPRGANRRIMRAMTQIARELCIHTLAEGMESMEQQNFLREIGCELAQGFLFHRPEPLEAILYRLGDGANARPCETPEERAAMIRKFFEKDL